MARPYRKSGLQRRHRTQFSATAAPGLGFPRAFVSDETGPRPPRIGWKAQLMADGSYFPVKVFAPRPAYSMDMDSLFPVDTMRLKSNRWGSRPGDTDSI